MSAVAPGKEVPATGGDHDLLLRATDVVKDFPLRGGLGTKRAIVHAVAGVSLEVRRGETLGIVGESGCGKSTLGRCLVRLTDVTSGSVVFDGHDITKLSRRKLRPYRRRMQLIFQDPYASLNPRRRVGEIVAEPMRVNHTEDRQAIEKRVQELFDVVRLDPSHINRFPHEFSGGQRQRIGIARALALNPSLVVADEPVSALDVSIQAQVLNLMADLQDQFALTYVFIAHDLGVIQHVSDRIGVMYLGELVELADAQPLYAAPLHPYTEALLSVVPELDDGTVPEREQILLTGDVPSPINKPTGCAFHPRCPVAQQRCADERPELTEVVPGRIVACHFPRNLDAAKAAAAAPAPPAG